MFNRKQIVALVIVAIALDVALMSQVCKAEDTTDAYYQQHGMNPPHGSAPALARPNTTYTTYGNRVIGSDGTTATQYGNRTVISDGRGPDVTCTTYGNRVICN